MHLLDPGEIEIEAEAVEPDGRSTRSETTALRLPRAFGDGSGDASLAGLRARVASVAAPAATTPPHRVLVVAPRESRPAARLALVDLVRRLGRASELGMHVLDPAPGADFAERIEVLGIPVHHAGSLLPRERRAYEARLAELAAWMAPHGFGAVLAETTSAFPLVDLASRLGIPSVWAVHESRPSPWGTLDELDQGEVPDQYVRDRYEHSLQVASAVIVDGPPETAPAGTDPQRVVALPWGVEVERLVTARESGRQRARAALGLADDAFLVACPWALEPSGERGPILEAFGAVAADHPRAVLALGSDAARGAQGLAARAERLGLGDRLRLVEVAGDVAGLFAAGDLLIHLSGEETLPRPVLEAMAVGLPVVARPTRGLEGVLEDGRSGFACSVPDPTSLATCLHRALEATTNGLEPMVEAARERVAESFSSSAHARRLAGLLGELAEDPDAPPVPASSVGPRRPVGLRRVPAVSVLIPTLDGGPRFEACLASLRAQRDVGELEIVVADSGSRDGTPGLAARAGARLLEVEPGTFNHGAVRERLAEAAGGELMLMFVQDARLAGRYAIAGLAAEIESDPRLAAVSARQAPGPDAELFSRFQLWLDNEHPAAPLGREGDWRPPHHGGFRVDDVCALVRREAWAELRYRELAFAEDMDFGFRAVEGGWRTAFSARVTVEHHHDRSAGYVLRRTTMGTLGTRRIAGLSPPADAGVDAGRAACLEVLPRFQAALSTLPAEPGPLAVRLRGLQLALREAGATAEPAGEFAQIRDALGEPAPAPAAADPALRSALGEVPSWPWLTAFALAERRPVEPDRLRDFLARLLAARIGAALGAALASEPDHPIARSFGEGI